MSCEAWYVCSDPGLAPPLARYEYQIRDGALAALAVITLMSSSLAVFRSALDLGLLHALAKLYQESISMDQQASFLVLPSDVCAIILLVRGRTHNAKHHLGAPRTATHYIVHYPAGSHTPS